MCKELARRSFNIVIVSRSQEKMDQAATAIKKVNSSCEVKTVVFDFTKTENAHSVSDY
jgi:short-subunit dehydrogenase